MVQWIPKGGSMTATSFCDGIRRRDFLRVGAASVFGLGFTLPGILAAQARASVFRRQRRDVSLILVFLKGGLSTIDAWDLKPNAPAEFRCEFRPMPTSVAGIHIIDHQPL